jgi:hypothetical protein
MTGVLSVSWPSVLRHGTITTQFVPANSMFAWAVYSRALTRVNT